MFLGLEKFDSGFMTMSGCGAWNIDMEPVLVISCPLYFIGVLMDPDMLDVREEVGSGVPTMPRYASIGMDWRYWDTMCCATGIAFCLVELVLTDESRGDLGGVGGR